MGQFDWQIFFVLDQKIAVVLGNIPVLPICVIVPVETDPNLLYSGQIWFDLSSYPVTVCPLSVYNNNKIMLRLV